MSTAKPAVLTDSLFSDDDQETYWFKEYSPEQREEMAKSGQALPDGSYPVADIADLRNAIAAYGRAKNKVAAKRHIIKRARALGKMDLLPEDWPGSTKGKKTNEIIDAIIIERGIAGLVFDEEGEIVQCKPLAFTDLTPDFLNKLRELVKEKVKDGDLSASDWDSAVKKARAYAGGKAKAKKKDDDGIIPDDDDHMKKKKMAEESLSDWIRKVEAAVYEHTKDSNGQPKYWCRETFKSYVIVCEHATGKLFKVPYARTVGGDVEFGEFEEVEEEYVAVKMSLIDMCARGGQFRLFYEIPQAFATPPDWMPVLPKPGEYKHPDYGTIDLTKDRLANFITNFESNVYQSRLPINAEHKTTEDGAYGWITGLRQNDDGSVDGQVSWTDLGREAIENDRFQYVSPEWFDRWKQASTGKTIKDVLVGAALTVRPFFKEDAMRPLVASEQGWFLPAGRRNDQQSFAYFFTAATPISPNGGNAMADKQPDVQKGMTDAEAQKFAELSATVSEQADQIKALSETVTTKDAELKTASEELKQAKEQIGALTNSLTTLERQRRHDRFLNMATEFSGDHEQHVRFMELIADKTETGEASDEFKQYVERETAVANQLKSANLFTEIGSSRQNEVDKSAEAQLNAKAKEFQEKNPGMSFATAYSQIIDLNPDLYRQYREESRKGVH
jgi:hypothetical protein